MANLASTEADADHPTAPAEEAGPYVLNLCSSTTPMALAQTDLPELKRFTFFVSRRFEEGRERFRLHMGFFASQEEAEEWLSVVRDIYPGAWAGEAPGKKLRARAAEAAAAQARHAVGPQKTAAAPVTPVTTPAAVHTPAAAQTPATDRTPAAAQTSTPRSVARSQNTQSAAPPKVPTLVPTLHPPAAAPASARPAQATASVRPSAPAAGATRAAAQPSKSAPTASAAAQPSKAVPAAPPPSAKRPQAAPAPRAATPTAPAAAAQNSASSRPMPTARPAAASASSPQARAAATATAGGTQRPAAKPVPGKAGAPKAAPVAPAQGKPAAAPAPAPQPTAARSAQPPAASRTAQQLANKPLFANSNVREVLASLDTPEEATGETRLMPAPAVHADTEDDSSLTDTQVLRFLEIRRQEDSAKAHSPLQADDAAESGISLLKPDDTGTRRALKQAVTQNAPVSFAVQLQWSVQPVALDKVPPLAIFSAYTLYSVEGSREGRKWYGLRLGFFNDAISAKQVAYYVRSEFNSVAVVPVSPQERERATEDNQRFSGVSAPRKRRDNEDNEFKLIDLETPARAAAAAAAAASPSPSPGAAVSSPPAGAAASATPAQSASEARSAGKGGGKVGARERRTPQTLEETLEILGANELAIDTGTGESLNDTGVRHLRVEVQKNSPFSRLLERLSERVRKA